MRGCEMTDRWVVVTVVVTAATLDHARCAALPATSPVAAFTDTGQWSVVSGQFGQLGPCQGQKHVVTRSISPFPR